MGGWFSSKKIGESKARKCRGYAINTNYITGFDFNELVSLTRITYEFLTLPDPHPQLSFIVH